MSASPLKFAIFGNEHQVKKSTSILKVLSLLASLDTEVYIDKRFLDFLLTTNHIDLSTVKSFRGNDFDADFVISMGGDGTFLKAAARVGAKSIPIIGINTGRLGFLASVSPDEIEPAIRAICDGKYKIEEHSVIQMETQGEQLPCCPYALNDISVLKRDNASMITIRTVINGDYLATYQADGLIISTPTGSTAYSLSNGGPIIVPRAHILCVTPVAPHSLNVRPIVISDESVIQLTVESRNHNYLVAVDGRSAKLQEGTEITIHKAPYNVKIVKCQDQTFFHTLRQKMMWGLDTRE
jgi:NAD+ kinase